MDAIASPLPWYRRALAIVRRALGIAQPTRHSAGADWSPAFGALPSYDIEDSMSAMAALPWVYACVQARTEDMAGLPIRLSKRGTKRDKAIESHPFLDLLTAPTTWQIEEEWRRQLYIDLDLCQNAFALMLWQGSRVVSIPRLHPERIVIRPGPHGGPEAYEYQGAGVMELYAPSTIMHVCGPSWQADPRGLWGTGRIQPLHDTLTADRAIDRNAAKTAGSGRPDIILSPKEGETFGATQVEKLRELWNKLTTQKGGVLIAPGHVEAKPLSWSPRDIESTTLGLANRDKVLAVFGVTPSRIGLPTANYATAREQATRYWEGLQATARLWDGRLTWLARQAGYRDIEVWHDFSNVSALADVSDAQMDRIERWIVMGADPREAAAYEGLPDAPLVATPTPVPAPVPPTKLAIVPRWEGWERAGQSREAIWKHYADTVHAPALAAIRAAARKLLVAQAARMSARLELSLERLGLAKAAGAEDEGVVVHRDLVGDIVDEVVALMEEMPIARETLAESIGDAMRRGHAYAVSSGLPGASFDPSRPAVSRYIDTVTSNVSHTTAGKVRDIVELGLARGDTITDMQRALIESSAFSPSRALLIARTEATRAVQMGTNAAYQQAIEAGVDMEVEWFSSRDMHVRDAHAALDGQVIAVGGLFTDPLSGETAEGPGLFASAANNCNCRCTTRPKIKDES